MAEETKKDITTAANPWWSPWVLAWFIEPLMHSIRTRIPRFAGMKSGERILDVCCGTGALALYYARKGILATGIDLNPRMIEVAENKRKKLSLTTVSFHVGDAIYLPFKDNVFDYASLSMSLHEKEREDRDRIISEMKRVVKEKGDLIFIDYRLPLPRVPVSSTVKMIEFIAGREHNRCFKDYVKQGGLDELLNNNHLHQAKRLLIGPFALIKTPNN